MIEEGDREMGEEEKGSGRDDRTKFLMTMSGGNGQGRRISMGILG
jgi:hypothetical protein